MRYEFHCVGVQVSSLLGGYTVQRVCKVPRSFERTSRLHLQGFVVLTFRHQDLLTATYEGATFSRNVRVCYSTCDSMLRYV